MRIQIIKPKDQASGQFDGGKIKEQNQSVFPEKAPSLLE